MKRLIFLLFLVGTNVLISQESANTYELTKIDGKNYYIHIVEKGNTLYAISRKYAVSIDVLKEQNPSVKDGLTIGDRLLIPKKSVERKNIEDSPEIDGNFLIHEVAKKNTLYSIAKEYHVEINDIIAANPRLEEGLKKGMKIKIPIEKIKSERNDSIYIKPASASPYITHTVLAKETMYSLSKLYEVSIDSLMLVNNGLPEGLKEGQLINIPILKVYDLPDENIPLYDSTAVKEDYRVIPVSYTHLTLPTIYSV